MLLHPREANPGHYDAILELLREAGVEPRLELRDLSLDLAQMPVVEGRAVAIVGESWRLNLPGELVWLPLTPPAALEARLLARTLDRAPALDRLLNTVEEIADELGWRRDGSRASMPRSSLKKAPIVLSRPRPGRPSVEET